MSFSLKDLNSTSKNINNEIILDSNINIWRQLYTEKILKFIDEKNYTSAFSRKILHDNYKTLNLIYENMGHELIKNKMISYYEPTKKRIFNGKFLNSIIQNNQTISIKLDRLSPGIYVIHAIHPTSTIKQIFTINR